MIALNNLTVSYRHHPALHHISGSFAKGSLTAVVGPNGAGKSTTLQMLTGCLLPDNGKIEICGIDLRQNPILAKAQIGYLPGYSRYQPW